MSLHRINKSSVCEKFFEDVKKLVRDTNSRIKHLPGRESPLSRSSSSKSLESFEEEPMEKATVLPADPPQNSLPLTQIYPILINTLMTLDENKGAIRKGFRSFIKFIDFGNLRNLLFKRSEKGKTKYGSLLTLQQGPEGFAPAVEKLGDSVIFLQKALMSAVELRKTNTNEFTRNLNLLKDLRTTLDYFITSLEQQQRQ